MKIEKLAFLTLLTGLLITPALKADDISDNFTANLAQQPLDALTEDLGALMGGGSFHHGKALGFPIGFDVGVHVPVITFQKENTILKDNGRSMAAGWAQAEVGLPGKINVIARGGKIFDETAFGGGLRYGILKPSLPGLPALSLTALYNQLDHDYFELKTYSANLVLSIDFPFIDPYLGAGYDVSKLKPTALAFQGAPGTLSRSLEGESNGHRIEAGINLHLIPFTYLNLGAGIANGESMYHGGLGVAF